MKGSIKVIGSGFGRTGTFSLKQALEKLGFGPCYHMAEVSKHPEHANFWFNTEKESGDFEEFLKGYQSAVDWPSTYYWKELADTFPEAKVIHTIRDFDSWYESALSTIFKSITKNDLHLSPEVHFHSMAGKLVLEKTFDNRFMDREFVKQQFASHNEAVLDSIPSDRLLIFNIKEGWEPLCRFLNVNIPAEDFPKTNTRASFIKKAGLEL